MKTLPAVAVALLLISGTAMADSNDDVVYQRYDQRSGQHIDIPMDAACLEFAGQDMPIDGQIRLYAGRDDWEQAQQLAAIHCIAQRLHRIEQLLIIIAGAVKPIRDQPANRTDPAGSLNSGEIAD